MTLDTEQWVDGPTEIKDIAAAMREGNTEGLIKEETDEHNIQTLIDFAKSRELPEEWVWTTLEAVGAVCWKEEDGSVVVLSLEWDHLHQVHDQLKAMPIKLHSNFFPDQDKKPYEKLSAAERTSMKEKVYTEKHKLVNKYKNMGLDEPLIHGYWGGVADPFDGRVDWVRLEKFELKLKEAVLKQASARLAHALGVDLEKSEAIIDQEQVIRILEQNPDLEIGELQIVPEPDQPADIGGVTLLPEDQPQTQEVCDDAPLIEATQSGEGQPPAPVLPALTVDTAEATAEVTAEVERELFLPEHEAELTIIYQDGQLSGISEKLLKIWWNDIRRTSTNLKVIHDFQLLKAKIHAFRFAQNRVGATTLNEDGFLDIPGLLRSFGWLAMPKLTDPDCPNKAFACKNPEHLHFKIDEIGNRIARMKDEADAYRDNANIEAEKLETSAQNYLTAFGHLVSGYGEQGLKRTKSGKDPGSISGGKTVTMPRFQISFKKTGGTFFAKDKTGQTLAPMLMHTDELGDLSEWSDEEINLHNERRQALLDTGLELKVRAIYEFETDVLRTAIDNNLVSIDELDGVSKLPVDECGEYVVSGIKPPKPKKEKAQE